MPLGLLYIAAVLDKAGYQVEILDSFVADPSSRKVKDAMEVGMSYERIKEEIQNDIIMEGNRGFLLKEGKSTYSAKIKIEVKPLPSDK